MAWESSSSQTGQAGQETAASGGQIPAPGSPSVSPASARSGKDAGQGYCSEGHDIDPSYGECLLCGPEAYQRGAESVANAVAWIAEGHRENFTSAKAFCRSVLFSRSPIAEANDYDRGAYDAARKALGL